MPIPFDAGVAKIRSIIADMPAGPNHGMMDSAIMEKELREDQAVCDAEWMEWLAQYDDDGHLKPGLFGTSRYIPNYAYSFLAMSEAEQAAFVISEKKRMGML